MFPNLETLTVKYGTYIKDVLMAYDDPLEEFWSFSNLSDVLESLSYVKGWFKLDPNLYIILNPISNK